jgi:prepilin-type N-terminal cleavage/methylation domain-containing protein
VKVHRRGFTLTELLVVFAIIVIVTGIVISSQSSFNKTIVLSNTVYDIALSLRSAETFGLGGRAISTTPTGYGVHFDRALPKSFILFADTYPPASGTGCHATTDIAAPDAQSGDCMYYTQDVKVSTYTLGNNITISKICGFGGSGTQCSVGPPNANLATLDIVFARPNPDPLMSMNASYSAGATTAACLAFTSPQGGNRYLSISSSGLINANALSCP